MEASARAMISDPFPLMTVGLSPTSSLQAFNRQPEAPAATGSRTHGLPERAASSAASFMAGSQSAVRVPTLTQRASALGVKSGSSWREWSMAGEAPAARRVLAIRSMDTKLVMHWTSGDRRLTPARKVQATPAQSAAESPINLTSRSRAVFPPFSYQCNTYDTKWGMRGRASTFRANYILPIDSDNCCNLIPNFPLFLWLIP